MNVIGTNISAMRAANASTGASQSLSTAMERLSTGKRINSAKDDAAGLAISSRMSSQIKSMAVAVRNANDGISMAQTAEGALGQVTSMLQRMKELATQASNGTLQSADRSALQAEVKQLTAEIGNTANTTSFNGVKLLDTNKSIKLQTGVNSGETISMTLTGATANSLGLSRTVNAVNSGTNIELFDLTGGATATVNGVNLDANISAKDAAAAVSVGGVTATAASNDLTVTYTAGSIAAQTIQVSGVNVDLAANETAANAVIKINAALSASGKNLGIIASSTGATNLTLTAANGENISLTAGAGITAPTGNSQAITGTLASGVTSRGKFSVTSADASKVSVEADTATLTAMGIASSSTTTRAVDISSQDAAMAALATIDAALDKISATRGDLGAVQNRLQTTVNNLSTTTVNLSDAKSRIEDTDFSAESTALAKANILSQASTAMLAQANQSQQSVLQLLK